jgi:hypothetical protein
LNAKSADPTEYKIVVSEVEEVHLAVLMLVEFGWVDSILSQWQALPF